MRSVYIKFHPNQQFNEKAKTTNNRLILKLFEFLNLKKTLLFVFKRLLPKGGRICHKI